MFLAPFVVVFFVQLAVEFTPWRTGHWLATVLEFATVLVIAYALLRLRRKRLGFEYMRFAPGVIQFLRYSFWKRSAPTIRSYRMEPGTTVILAGSLIHFAGGSDEDGRPLSWWYRMSRAMQRPTAVMSILRDGCCEKTPIGLFRDSEAVQQKLFDALVSTATIPELSDTELTC